MALREKTKTVMFLLQNDNNHANGLTMGMSLRHVFYSTVRFLIQQCFKRTGAEVYPAIVSGIVTEDTLVGDWPKVFPCP